MKKSTLGIFVFCDLLSIALADPASTQEKQTAPQESTVEASTPADLKSLGVTGQESDVVNASIVGLLVMGSKPSAAILDKRTGAPGWYRIGDQFHGFTIAGITSDAVKFKHKATNKITTLTLQGGTISDAPADVPEEYSKAWINSKTQPSHD